MFLIFILLYFQGSESETVIYLLGNSGAQNWQHVYTAITRGKTRVYIIGTKTQLYKAIRRDANPRNTEMRAMLMDEIIPKLNQMQQEELNQTCSRQQQLVHRQQQQSQGYSSNATMRCQSALPSQQVSESQSDSGSTRNSQMYNASQCGSAQVCNSTLTRPNVKSQTYEYSRSHTGPVCNSTHRGPNFKSQTNQYSNIRSTSVHNFAPNRQASSQDGFQPGQSTFQPPQPTRTVGFFQPLMTSTQVSRTRQSGPTQGQYRQKPLFSPTKVFTSIRDVPKPSDTKELPNTESNVKGIVHSTPKQTATCEENFEDEWSNEWSPERLQQVIDMETTAMATQSDNKTPPPLYDEDSKSDTSESPTDSGFKSTPPNSEEAKPEVVSPFTPNTSMRLGAAWGVKTPPKGIVAKRLYTDMKDSPVTDDLPNKKRNDFNESDLF